MGDSETLDDDQPEADRRRKKALNETVRAHL
jgi:hypothetical protein